MKMIILALSLIYLNPAYAYINEIECEGQAGGESVTLEIERPFPNGSAQRWAKLSTRENSFNYSIYAHRIGGLNRVEYRGGGLKLELDLWPDGRPHWGRTYRGNLSSFDVAQGQIIPVACHFPNII